MRPGDNEITSRQFGQIDPTRLGPDYAKVFRRWADACTEQALTSRSLVDPGWVGRLISSAMLFQIEGDDMRHRIVGQHFLSQNGGFDPTGRTLKDLCETRPVARILYPEYQRVVAEATPAIVSLTYLTVKETIRRCSIMILPLCDRKPADRVVTHLLSVYHFDPID